MYTELDLKKMERLNLSIKKELVSALLHIGYGHFGGSLSVTELLACLYGHYLKHDVQNPKDTERDLLVLSKGHAGPALYATLALRGFFELSQLQTINANGTSLPSHADMNKTVGIDMTTGSLGQGISCAVGMAKGTKSKVFAIVGDGELQEGQCWEAIQFAAHHKLSNFYLFIDNNKWQLDGALDDVQCSFDLQAKLASFGFMSLSANGGNVASIADAIEFALECDDKPVAIILDTIKGQGIPSIASIANNHHLRIDSELEKSIRADLEQIEKNIGEA